MEPEEERPEDGWEVEALFDLCFAPGREALSSYRLREGVAPVASLCLVLRDGGAVAAAIRHRPVRIGPAPAEGGVGGVAAVCRGAGPSAAGTAWSQLTQPRGAAPGGDNEAGVPALLLGPVAVHPTRQGEGLGAWLITESLERARALGWSRVMLVGDAPYYGRFGFARLEGVEMPPPTNPDRVLGVALHPGAWEDVTGAVLRAS